MLPFLTKRILFRIVLIFLARTLFLRKTKETFYSLKHNTFACFLLIFTISSVCSSQIDSGSVDNLEIDFYLKQGIQPFVSSEQDGEYPAGTYLVLHDLIIEKGKTMTLYSGTKILFKKNTRLIVRGTLTCEGQSGSPIIFDKFQNSSYYNSLDTIGDSIWNGIYVSDSGSLEMNFAEIKNSKYGLVTQYNANMLSLDSLRFFNNKFSSFRYKNEVLEIPEDKFVSILWSSSDNTVPEVKFNDEQPSISPQPVATPIADSIIPVKESSVLKINPPPQNRLRRISGVTAIIGATAAAGGYCLHRYYYSQYDKEKSRNPALSDPSDVSQYEKFSKAGYWVFIGGTAIGAVGLSVFTLTFVF